MTDDPDVDLSLLLLPPPPTTASPLPPVATAAFGFSHSTLTMNDVVNETCTACGGSDIVTLFKEGRSVCGQCGLVISEVVIDDGSEWRTFSNDNNNPQTQRANHFKDADPEAGLTTVLSAVPAADETSRLVFTQQKTVADQSSQHHAKKEELRKFMCDVLTLPYDSKELVVTQAVDMAIRFLAKQNPHIKMESVALAALETASRLNDKSVHALSAAKSKGVSVHLAQKRFREMKAMIKDDQCKNDAVVPLNDVAQHATKQKTDRKRREIGIKLQAPTSESSEVDQHCLRLGLKVPRDSDVVRFMLKRYQFIGDFCGKATRQPKTQLAAMLLLYWDVMTPVQQQTKSERIQKTQMICDMCDIKEKTLRSFYEEVFPFRFGLFPIRYGPNDHTKISLPIEDKWKVGICQSTAIHANEFLELRSFFDSSQIFTIAHLNTCVSCYSLK